MFPGIGTLVNVATVLLGATIGVLLGHRLPERTRDVVTDALGLVTLLIAGLSAVAVTDVELIGVRRQQRTDADRAGLDGDRRDHRVPAAAGGPGRSRSAAGCRAASRAIRAPWSDSGSSRASWSSSLVFCTGPLTILGSLNDGLGLGAEQLYPQGDARRFRRDRVRRVLRVGRRRERPDRARVQGGAHRRRAAPRRRAARCPHRRGDGGGRAAARRCRAPAAARARDPGGRPAARARWWLRCCCRPWRHFASRARVPPRRGNLPPNLPLRCRWF